MTENVNEQLHAHPFLDADPEAEDALFGAPYAPGPHGMAPPAVLLPLFGPAPQHHMKPGPRPDPSACKACLRTTGHRFGCRAIWKGALHA